MSEEKKKAKLNEEELEKVSGGLPGIAIRGISGATACVYLADDNKCTCLLSSCPNNFLCGVFNESTYPNGQSIGILVQ